MVEAANNCQRCDAERRRADAILADLENAETELRVGRRREQALRTELRKHLEEDAGASDVKEILAEWKIVCGHPKAKTPMDGARAKAVRRMLKAGYSVEQLKKAVMGCGRFPYVGATGRLPTGDRTNRHDDLTLILRDESTVERFIAYADRPDEPPSPDNVVPLRPIQGGGAGAAKLKFQLDEAGEMLNEALRQVATLRRVVELQQDMIRLEASVNDGLLTELAEARGEAAA